MAASLRTFWKKGTRTLALAVTITQGLQHLLQLIVHELNLGADDDLAGSCWADDTGSTGSLDSLFIHSGVSFISKRRRVAQ